jgi:hypothetical protein
MVLQKDKIKQNQKNQKKNLISHNHSIFFRFQQNQYNHKITKSQNQQYQKKSNFTKSVHFFKISTKSSKSQNKTKTNSNFTKSVHFFLDFNKKKNQKKKYNFTKLVFF